ncbi:MAG: methyltransferase domain-containing protein [Tissierellia bacterium]|nr:methyltransferase domain-containing protein [Tissierellia bacterium]
MAFKHFINPVATAKKIMSHCIKEGNIVLDCTVGNGNDTLLLARLVGQTGKVYGFDIQSIAIQITEEKLIKEGLDKRVILINDSHENIDQYISEKLHLIIYNLGYLPGGDKRIKTSAVTTINSIRKALTLLDRNGLLLVTCYRGHEGGEEESKAVREMLQSLNQREYNVLEFNFLNHINKPPILYGIEKL